MSTPELHYTVMCINGFRRGNLTLDAAKELARWLERQWAEVGQVVEAHVYYLNGSEVQWRASPPPARPHPKR